MEKEILNRFLSLLRESILTGDSTKVEGAVRVLRESPSEVVEKTTRVLGECSRQLSGGFW